MAEFNLLSTHPKIVRDIQARTKNKEENRAAALAFGFAYFDGPREQGYGGYTYDGRWQPVARKIIERYALKPGMSVLDIGCAKGFLVKDLIDALPGLRVFGLDISHYALERSPPEARPYMVRGDCRRLPFGDDRFDAVISINTIHNVDRPGCVAALKEIERVGKIGNAFVQIDAFTSEREKALFEDWMLTAKTFGKPDEWIAIFEEAGYRGDHYWTILTEEQG